jgi:hypothetical protein
MMQIWRRISAGLAAFTLVGTFTAHADYYNPSSRLGPPVFKTAMSQSRPMSNAREHLVRVNNAFYLVRYKSPQQFRSDPRRNPIESAQRLTQKQVREEISLGKVPRVIAGPTVTAAFVLEAAAEEKAPALTPTLQQ